MPIYSGEPNVSPGTDIQSLRASLPEELGAEAGQALSEGPSAQLYGLGELADAKADTSSRSSLASPYPFGWMMGAKPADQPAADIPTDQARLQVKAAGLDQTITLPDQPTIKAPVLDIMMRRAQADRERAATIARGPDGFVSNALAAGTTFGASILDPLNMAAFSIPVMGEARYAKLLADAGDSIAARAALRAGVGAAQGALGSTALTPLDWLAHTQEGQDYSMADALRSILMGAGQGAAFHAGGGLVGDVYKRLRGRPLNAEAPAAPPAPGQPAAGPGLPPAEPEGPVPPASEAPAAAAPSSFVDAARRAAQASAAEEQGAPNPDLRTPPTVAADLPGREIGRAHV